MRPNTVLTMAVLVLAVASISGCTNTPSKSPLNANSHTITWISGGPEGYVDLGSFAGEGSVEPYNCTLTNGALPNGFTLEGCILSGRVSNMPEGTTEILNPPFTVVINDSSKLPVTKTVEVSIQFIKNDMVLETYKLSTCTAGERCAVKIVDKVTGGTEPYGFSLDSLANGAPPMGMTVNQQDGTLTGTPSVAGNYKFNICVRDSVGAMLCDETEVKVNEGVKPTVETEPVVAITSSSCEFLRYDTPWDPNPWCSDYRITASGTLTNGNVNSSLTVGVIGQPKRDAQPPEFSCGDWAVGQNTVQNQMTCSPTSAAMSSQTNWQFSVEVSPTCGLGIRYLVNAQTDVKNRQEVEVICKDAAGRATFSH